MFVCMSACTIGCEYELMNSYVRMYMHVFVHVQCAQCAQCAQWCTVVHSVCVCVCVGCVINVPVTYVVCTVSIVY